MQKDIKIEMPMAAKKIIDKLYSAGHEAYIVGGCVRDALLGRRAGDFDITTDAEPCEVKLLFEKTVDTGIKHGTVTVIEDGEPYEVTTYRIDGEYTDSRHPVSVSYTKNLTDDLSRRDFTVNAMAYNDRIGLVDVFSSSSDLEAGIIRAVGDPYLRFGEDALRILRGIRFASVLGFTVEEKTSEALKELSPGLQNVSAERIYAEWKKLLSGEGAYCVIKEYNDVISVFMPELSSVVMPEATSFDELSWDERQIALFASISDKSCFRYAADRLRMESKTREKAVSVLNNLICTPHLSDEELKLYLIDRDDEIALSAARVSVALGLTEAETYSALSELIEKDHPRRISQLAIGGRELKALGAKGRDIGRLLSMLIREVAVGNLLNCPESLIDRAQNFISSHII